MIWDFPEQCGDNPPPSLFHWLHLDQQIHWQHNSPTAWYYQHRAWQQLWVKGLAVSPPNILLLIVVKQLSVSSDHRVFLQKVFVFVHVTLDILTSFLSAAGDILCFLMVAVTQLCHALYTYKQLFVQLIFGAVTALKWLQVTFLNQFFGTVVFKRRRKKRL